MGRMTVGVVCWTTRLWLHVNVGDAASFSILWENVVLGEIWVLCDDVPGVEESWDEAEHAEKNVDERVG